MNRDFFHTGLQVSRSDLQALLNGGDREINIMSITVMEMT